MDDADHSVENEILTISRLLAARKQRKGYISPDNKAAKGELIRYCEECGTQIPAERIRAVNAFLCVFCQQREEKINGLYS